MPAPTPPVPVTLNLGFAPDDGAGDGVRLVFEALLSALEARGARKGVASLCIGGGEAVAMAVERV